MEEVVHKISVTEAKIAAAESNGDIARRNTLESYLIELQKKENLLLQQLQQAPAPGNYLHRCGQGMVRQKSNF
jgi:hypothetical protein